MLMKPGREGIPIRTERFKQFLDATHCIGMNEDAGGYNLFKTLIPDDVIVVRIGGGNSSVLVEVADSDQSIVIDTNQWPDFAWITHFRRVRVLARDGSIDFRGVLGTFSSADAQKIQIAAWYYKTKESQMIETLITLLESNKQVILTGSPGTGKTFLARQLAAKLLKCPVEALAKGEYKNRFGFVQFHPAYDYTDFVEGLKPVVKGEKAQIAFELRNGIFRDFCEKAEKQQERNVFVIDEINRADLSRVFGELFYALEPNYRGQNGAVLTQYASLREESDRYFHVPKNVFIIGTMNDIDRSVESIDFALRRRFAWYEIEANASRFDAVMSDVLTDKLSLKAEAKDRYEKLNESISNEGGLGPAYNIGPAYYRNLDHICEEQNQQDIWDVFWKRHLGLLIHEYVRGMPKAKELIKKFRDAYNLNPVATKQNEVL